MGHPVDCIVLKIYLPGNINKELVDQYILRKIKPYTKFIHLPEMCAGAVRHQERREDKRVQHRHRGQRRLHPDLRLGVPVRPLPPGAVESQVRKSKYDYYPIYIQNIC